MSLAQSMYFLQTVFQMTTIALVSVMNHNHINGLHLFWDTVYYSKLIKSLYENKYLLDMWILDHGAILFQYKFECMVIK